MANWLQSMWLVITDYTDSADQLLLNDYDKSAVLIDALGYPSSWISNARALGVAKRNLQVELAN